VLHDDITELRKQLFEQQERTEYNSYFRRNIDLPEVSIPCQISKHFKREDLRRNEATEVKGELNKCHQEIQKLQIKPRKEEDRYSLYAEVSKFFHIIYILHFQI
jgi:hypothetical protein